MRNEYPRPLKRRDSFISLNKEWEFAFDDLNVGHKEKWFNNHHYDKKINVPFCFQAKLSGIGDTSFHDHVWYKTKLDHLPLKEDERLLINFMGVDYYCEVYLNGMMIKTHYGAAGMFYADLTDYLSQEDNILVVYCYDPSVDKSIPRGKQDWELIGHAIWYTRTTGIYKPVFLEVVNEKHLENFYLKTDVDNLEVTIDLETNFSSGYANFVVSDSHRAINYEMPIKKNKDFYNFKLDENFVNGRLYSYQHPFLFDLKIELYDEGHQLKDVVYSYFGLRKIETRDKKVYINNEYVYQKLVLNQGYNIEGILTYPTIEMMEQDIRYMMEMGFNGCRIHQKVEDQYFLYLCDKMGFIVWQEQGSAYGYTSLNPRRMLNEWIDIVKENYNHPSIIAYTPLNESWGIEGIPNSKIIQAHALSLYYLIKSLDDTRLVISNDGWEHCKTDLITIHNYDHGAKDEQAKQKRFEDLLSTREKILRKENINRYILLPGYLDEGQPILLTEFGGVAYRVQAYNGQDWGYTTSANLDEYKADLKRIYLAISKSQCIEGICYTQFSDVEQEINGLMTYDRKYKVDPKYIKELNDSLGGK